MNTDIVIYALTLLMLFFGWLIAFLSYRRKIVRERAEHRIALDEAWVNGWNRGWHDLSRDVIALKGYYDETFKSKK